MKKAKSATRKPRASKKADVEFKLEKGVLIRAASGKLFYLQDEQLTGFPLPVKASMSDLVELIDFEALASGNFLIWPMKRRG